MKKKGLKCGLLLALFITLGLSLSVSLDTKALRHNLAGFPLFQLNIPSRQVVDNNTGKKHLDWSYADNVRTIGYTFALEFEGDSYSSDLDDIYINKSHSIIFPANSSDFDKCLYQDVLPIFEKGNSPLSITTSSQMPLYLSNWQSNALSDFQKCQSRGDYGTNNLLQFDNNSLPNTLLSCSPSNGAVCGGLWNTKEYLSSQVLPAPFTTDMVLMQSTFRDEQTGLSYSNALSLSQIFNKPIHKFSLLRIPLHTYDGYFLNSDNLTQGRPIELKGVFEFDGSFNWHNNISNNGSYFRFALSGVEYDNYDFNIGYHEQYVDCNTNLIQLSDVTQLEYSCPLILDYNYQYIEPYLEISGNGNYVFETDDLWRFYFTYIVTDNDETPGYSFNTDGLHTDRSFGWAGDEADDDIASWDVTDIVAFMDNFWENIWDLFTFNLFNPFSAFFTSFSDSSSCANIPIIGGMLHSDETQVCPFFNNTVRDIGTPVFMISSSMILFGFIVRWLKSSSSDFSPTTEGSK